MDMNELLKLPKEQRRKFWQSVECVPGCGNCCGNCPLLSQEKKCTVHPSLPHVGTELQRARLGGNPQCRLSPIEVFIGGSYCLAVINILQPCLSFAIEPHQDAHRGTINMANSDQVFRASRRLRGFED